MDDTLEQLRRAYRLIRHDRIDEAQAILRPFLDEDPDNVHAWWLMAHATRDRDEIRQALSTVLSLDPHYTNAPKAYELLTNLDQRFPSPDDLADFGDQRVLEDPFAALEDEPFLAEEPFSEAEFRLGAVAQDEFDLETDAEFQREIFSTDVFSESSGAPNDFFVDDEDPFADLETDAFFTDDAETDTAAVAASALEAEDEDLSALFEIDSEILEDEELSPESQSSVPVERKSRRRWLLAAPIILLAIVLIVVLAILLGSKGGAKVADPGPLNVVQTQSEQVTAALNAAGSALQAADLGNDARVVVAESQLGNALFVEFCVTPDTSLVSSVEQGMAIAAQQAAAVENELPAVGVSVNRCQSAQHDTLYRAVVAAGEAVRFTSGQLGPADVSMATFQSYWKTS